MRDIMSMTEDERAAYRHGMAEDERMRRRARGMGLDGDEVEGYVWAERWHNRGGQEAAGFEADDEDVREYRRFHGPPS